MSLPYLIPSHVLGGPDQPGANERVHVGIIGLGGRAHDIAKTCFDVPRIRVVAVCDCFLPRCNDFVKALGKDQNWKAYEDFRQMIAKEKLDGVMVETTTHARAWIVIQAMQAGLDVYIEKPMCLTIAEGRTMVKAARKYNRVTQVGTQQRSMPINNWASDLVKNGALGKILTVIAPELRRPREVDGPTRPADAAGWKRQLVGRVDQSGRVAAVPSVPASRLGSLVGLRRRRPLLRRHRLGRPFLRPDQPRPGHRRDRAGRGAAGGAGQGDGHRQVRPNTAAREGSSAQEDTGTDYHGMAKLEGPRAKVTMKFANGTELKLHLDGDHGPGLGAIFVGEKGKIEINRNKIASNPKELVRSPDNPGHNKRPETTYHVENWVDCIKSRKPCNADIEIGQRSSTLCYLVNIARDVGRVGEVLKWDPVAERFTNCDEANKLLDRPRRKGYELPEIG